MRRANGTGSIYKMTHKKLRKPYRAVVSLRQDEEGRVIRKTIGTFTTAKEALLALSEYCVNPSVADSRLITVRQVWDLLIEDLKRRNVMITSPYKMTEKKLAGLMNAPIRDVRLAHLQRIFDEDMGDLKKSTVSQIKSKLSMLFKMAIKNDYVDKNYGAMVVINATEESDPLHRPYTSDEIETLWMNTDDYRVRIILIYLYTGLRSSELLSIKITDVHLKERYLVGGMKTKVGKNRIIPIADCIMPFIRELYDKNKFNRSGRLCPKGTMWPRYITDAALKNLGIDRHTPHDTRHTFITWLTNYGVSEKIIKTIVGHSQTGDVTKDVYTHLVTDQLLEAVNKLPHTDNIKLFPGEKKSCTMVVQRA